MKDERSSGRDLNRADAESATIGKKSIHRQHASSLIPHPPSFLSRWRNPILGATLVSAGLATAVLTLMARRLDAPGLASVGAVASLVFALLITILIVPPLSRSAFAEVTRRGWPLEVTSGGIVFVLALIIVALAAWNTGNNLLFLIFSIMLSTLFVSWAAARVSLRDLTVTAHFPDHIFASEPAEVTVTVRNGKRVLPSFSVLVAARGPAARSYHTRSRRVRFLKRTLAYFIYIPHQAAAEQQIEKTFAKRGHVIVNGFELSTGFPFGFFRHRRRLTARDVDIIVYPKPEPVADELNLLPLYSGQTASFRRGAGHDLLMLRDYQPRDELRHIDWKATARARRLTVREFTAEDERRITIMLDTRLTEDIDAENFRIRFESGVVQAASLVKHFIDESADVSLVLGNERGSFGTGPEQLYACLRRLAIIEPEAKVSSDEWPPEFMQSANLPGYAGDGNYFIVLTAAARGSIPPQIWRRAYVIYL